MPQALQTTEGTGAATNTIFGQKLQENSKRSYRICERGGGSLNTGFFIGTIKKTSKQKEVYSNRSLRQVKKLILKI
jgi:hypothetical protein